jgi:hypothetical protein
VECISTGTPIIVNYHPAIVEYLGEDYPLYFNRIYNDKTHSYHINTEHLLKAHYYLLNIKNNSKIELCDFLNEFKIIIDKILNNNHQNNNHQNNNHQNNNHQNNNHQHNNHQNKPNIKNIKFLNKYKKFT